MLKKGNELTDVGCFSTLHFVCFCYFAETISNLWIAWVAQQSRSNALKDVLRVVSASPTVTFQPFLPPYSRESSLYVHDCN